MSLSSEVADRLYQTVANVLGVDPDSLTEDASPEEVETWDSLNHLNLVMALEEEFELSLTPEDTLQMSSVGAIRAILGKESVVMPEVDIRFADCRAVHIDQLKAFIARSYGAGYVLGVNDAYFQWQYAAPAVAGSEKINLRLAFVDGQIAGCLGYIPVEVNVGGRNLRGCWLANWMVDPVRRDLGLGPFLVRDVAEEFEISLALGANRDAREILTRMGWTDFGMLRRYVRVLDRAQAARLTETGELDWPVPAPCAELQLRADTVISALRRFDKRVVQLWESIYGGELSAGTRRTAQFLNWRYTDHPQFDYQVFQAYRDDALKGFAVYHVEQARDMPVRVGRLVELVGDPQVEHCLLHEVIKHAVGQGVAAIDFFCATARIETTLAQNGFLPGDHPEAAKIPVLYQPIDRRRAGVTFLADLQNIPDADAITDWYVTKSDGDQDRPN